MAKLEPERICYSPFQKSVMTELQEAREVAIGLGGTITDNSVGFIACFSDEPIAQHYLTLVEDYESLAAEKQDRCVVTIVAASLM